MPNPTVPQYISTSWDVGEFKPGGALPSIYPTGTYVTLQATLDAIVTAAATTTSPRVVLAFSTVPPPGYMPPGWVTNPNPTYPVVSDGTNLYANDQQLAITGGSGSTIDDTTISTTKVWSSSKVQSAISSAIAAALANYIQKPGPTIPAGYTLVANGASNATWQLISGGGGGGVGGDSFDVAADGYDEIVIGVGSPDTWTVDSSGFDVLTLDPSSTATFGTDSNGFDTVIIP